MSALDRKRTFADVCYQAMGGRLYTASFLARMAMEVLQCLKKYGQRLDLEIAKETGVPLQTVREELAALAASGEIIMCKLTRFNHGQKTEAWQCRAAGYYPPRSPGAKPKPAT